VGKGWDIPGSADQEAQQIPVSTCDHAINEIKAVDSTGKPVLSSLIVTLSRLVIQL